MLIKQADDKAKDIEILRSLLSHPDASAETRRNIEQEIKFVLSGIKGENEAAYEINFDFAASKNWMVIHDLRIEHNGRVAQIDHLLINRFLDIWVCESKRFGEGIAINEHGECAAFFAGKPYGVPSPFEQNRKHCAVLKALLDDGVVDLPRRLGLAIKPTIRSLVLVSKNARISRPKAELEGLGDILKADQISTHIEKDSDNSVLALAKVIATETLEGFARALAAAHRPIAFDWPAKFGLSKVVPAVIAPPLAVPEAEPAPVVEAEKKSKLDCATCGVRVSYTVAKFCWGNKAKYGGAVFCMDCQKKVAVAAQPL